MVKSKSGRYVAMGGSSIAMRSPMHLSVSNPASYTAMDSLSFIFDMGVKDKLIYFADSLSKEKTNNVNIDYIDIAFPLLHAKNNKLKWVMGLGMSPWSEIGYRLLSTTQDIDIGTVRHYSIGSGGLNRFHMTQAIELFNRLSLGMNASYIYGNIKKTNSIQFPYNPYIFNFQSEETTFIHGFLLEYGLQYYQKIQDKYILGLGVTYSGSSSIAGSRDYLAITTTSDYIENIDARYARDTVLQYDDLQGSIVLPTTYGIGLSLEKEDRFVLGVEYRAENWRESSIFGDRDSLVNSRHIGLGAEYIPDAKSLTNYFKRVRYRIGGYYENTPFKVNSVQLTDYGMSFGFGFPLRQKTSYNVTTNKPSINMSFQIGQRGTLDNNLVKENYYIFTLNMTLHDIWFIKRKID